MLFLNMSRDLLPTPQIEMTIWTAKLPQLQVLLYNMIFGFVVPCILKSTQFASEVDRLVGRQ